MSARLVWLVCSRLASALQLCPIWTCNFVQKYFATLSKKGLQKTNSFHGTVFSINFQKEFWIAARHDEQGNAVVDERLENILSKTELLDRIVDVNSSESVEYQTKIDYESVSKSLKPLVDDSIEYLKKGLN